MGKKQRADAERDRVAVSGMHSGAVPSGRSQQVSQQVITHLQIKIRTIEDEIRK